MELAKTYRKNENRERIVGVSTATAPGFGTGQPMSRIGAPNPGRGSRNVRRIIGSGRNDNTNEGDRAGCHLLEHDASATNSHARPQRQGRIATVKLNNRSMVAANEQAGVWDSTPLTKFRIPRLRRDAVARPGLIARVASAVESNPVTLLSAPGGYGKTTALAQYALAAGDSHAVVWMAIDEDDNDSYRLLVSLLRAAEALSLAWEAEPRDLLAAATGSPSQQRTAIAALVNALCTSSAGRIVLVLDDFHRLDAGPCLTLIESFVERLPDHVGLLIGTRIEPALPLARWRVHGELAEFSPADLEFSEADATALAAARLGAAPALQLVHNVLRRTHGWAAGLSLALQARAATPGLAAPIGGDDARDRHLFAYLAQEVLAELPEDLQQFVMQCSILAELNPEICQAVSGRTDSRAVLVDLYRRNLFLTAIDETTPVLRFHDLFKEFLHNELVRRDPQAAMKLHALAGHAEVVATRAVAHFLSAQSWQEAMALIGRRGEAMLIEGSSAALERWIDAIPEAVRSPSITYLRGVCAWLKWDWPRAKREFVAALPGLTAPEFHARKLRCMFMYVDALNSSGDPAGAAQVLDEIAKLPLDDVASAQLALQRAWHAIPQGEPERVGRYHEEFVAHARNNPTRVCPAAADLFHCVCIGLPGVAATFDRYFELTQQVHTESRSPWKFAALTVGVWAHFWHGRRAQVEALLREGEALYQRFGAIRLVAERLVQFKALYFGAIGDSRAGIAVTKTALAGLELPEAAGHRAAWQRAYLHGLARQHWMAMDAAAYTALLPQLLGPRRPAEWPFIDAATHTALGQVAVLNRQWAEAQRSLETAVQLHARFRLPMTYGDPRVALAYAQLMMNKQDDALRTFMPVYEEVIHEQAVGLVLLEARPIVTALLDALPADVRGATQHQALLHQLGEWIREPVAPSVQAAQTANKLMLGGALSGLSERELEVLGQVAAGASNKHIARDLALSLHTVKRHIANILDKLDCASRGQAADLFRRG